MSKRSREGEDHADSPSSGWSSSRGSSPDSNQAELNNTTGSPAEDEISQFLAYLDTLPEDGRKIIERGHALLQAANTLREGSTATITNGNPTSQARNTLREGSGANNSATTTNGNPTSQARNTLREATSQARNTLREGSGANHTIQTTNGSTGVQTNTVNEGRNDTTTVPDASSRTTPSVFATLLGQPPRLDAHLTHTGTGPQLTPNSGLPAEHTNAVRNQPHQVSTTDQTASVHTQPSQAVTSPLGHTANAHPSPQQALTTPLGYAAPDPFQPQQFFTAPLGHTATTHLLPQQTLMTNMPGTQYPAAPNIVYVNANPKTTANEGVRRGTMGLLNFYQHGVGFSQQFFSRYNVTRPSEAFELRSGTDYNFAGIANVMLSRGVVDNTPTNLAILAEIIAYFGLQEQERRHPRLNRSATDTMRIAAQLRDSVSGVRAMEMDDHLDTLTGVTQTNTNTNTTGTLQHPRQPTHQRQPRHQQRPGNTGLSRNHGNNNPRPTGNANSQTGRQAPQPNILNCQICGRPGHSARTCTRRHRRN